MVRQISRHITRSFEHTVRKVEYSLRAKEFLRKFLTYLQERNYPLTLDMMEITHEFDKIVVTGQSGAERIPSVLVPAYNNDPEKLLKRLTYYIDWMIKIGKPVTIDALLEIMLDTSVPENISLSPDQQLILDMIISNLGLTEKEVWAKYNVLREEIGLGKPILFSSFLNQVHHLRKKLRFQIVPITDYYRIGLVPIFITAWIDKGEMGKKITIDHPYMRFTSVLFEDSYKKLAVFAINPPHGHMGDVIREVRLNPSFERPQVHFFESVAHNVNPRTIRKVGSSWSIDEEYLKELLTSTPLDALENMSIKLSSEFVFWHSNVEFTNRGERIIEVDMFTLLTLHGLLRASGTTKKLKPNANAVRELYLRQNLSIPYARIRKKLDELARKQVFQWRPNMYLLSSRVLTIYVENPSRELEFLLLAAIAIFPKSAILKGYDYHHPERKTLLIEVNIPAVTSLPILFHEFLSNHLDEMDRFVVSPTVKRVPSPLNYEQLWDEKERKWIWNSDMKIDLTL